jgi:hypothetical protein
MAAATSDETVLAAVTDVVFLVAPPGSLFRPGVAWRAVRRCGASRPTVAGVESDVVPALPNASVATMR